VLEQPRKQIWVFVTSGILVTGAGVALVQWLGAVGGALALLLVYLIQAGLLLRTSQRLFRVEFEWSRVAKVLWALGAAFVAVHLVGAAAAAPVVNWLLAPAFLTLSVVALIVLRFPDPGEIAHVRAAATRFARVR